MLAGPFLETIKAQSNSSCPYDMAMELQLFKWEDKYNEIFRCLAYWCSNRFDRSLVCDEKPLVSGKVLYGNR